MPNGIQQYTKLENRLVLLAWLNSLLGYESNRDLLKDTKDISEGIGPDGRSYLYHQFISRGSRLKIPADDLARYDENIRLHLEKINRSRTERITLRYFQYLAVLYTEILLDRLFNHKDQLIAELNDFVHQRNVNRLIDEPQDEPFTEADFTKLAYWMATGSGKTIILHLNYHQFQHYNKEPLDNILLITPNEGLSEQHLEELAASGIPAKRFDLNSSGLWPSGKEVIQIIEITKLVKEKRGGGESVPVEAFEGHNLIFVDEGHKGSGGEAWRCYREALGATGFTFEYSATFGQALSAARNDPLTTEYGKAIIFDYSYRYFYGDGFGKDFHILNLRDETDQQKTDLLLLGNLLSFYEQLRLFDEQGDSFRSYNLEKPLWVFVGSTVNAVYTENKQPRSDVLTVVRFMHRFLKDQRWAVKAIQDVLNGETGLTMPDGRDLFAGRFNLLRVAGIADDKSALYDDILKRVFHAESCAGLHLCEIKNSQGELGLKAAVGEHYFGLIYISDSNAFKQLVEKDTPDIILEQDVISGSLFNQINCPDSMLHILIGAKKFMEGWNSWRVASMGLLNIGRQEGSQIIQLFGRGVRLKGKDLSLKRSSALPGDHPRYLSLLETLNIFAIRANYMAQFRDYLEREGVEVEEPMQLTIPIRMNEEFLNKGLVIPRPVKDRSFEREQVLILDVDRRIKVFVDMSLHLQVIQSRPLEHQVDEVQSGTPQTIPDRYLDLIDWEKVYFDLLDFKKRKALNNLIIYLNVLRKIIENIDYTLIADEAIVKPRSFRERIFLQEAVTNILRKYVASFYAARREKWEEKVALTYYNVDRTDPNLAFNKVKEECDGAYKIEVSRSNRELIESIQNLINNVDQLYHNEGDELARIYFDRHLYLPIIIEKSEEIKSIPPALKESEAKFIIDLKNYWEAEKQARLKGKEIFLLRNLSRGRGIGFFEERGFYPDFILWIIDKEKNQQRIVFVEPHGMIYAKPYEHDDKARLHERLPELAKEIGNRTGRNDISLDSFIVSVTPYEVLKKRYDNGKWDRNKFSEKHILFQDEGCDYLAKILDVK